MVEPVDITPKHDKEEDKVTEDIVTGTEVVAASEKGIDYEKLLVKFGCFALNTDIISKIEALTGKKAHRFLRRNIFFCHRDLEIILNHYEKGQPFYLYTGRGPSADSLHMGHTIPFIFT